ncbi:MAG: hypothetical protein ACI8ZO_000389 [Flavobacteriales bacterium]|jgi:hypothetical protein
MNLRYTITALLFSLSLATFGQKYALEFEGDIISTGIKGNLILPLMLNKNIDEEAKKKISDGLVDRNKFGSNLNFNFRYQFNNDYGFVISSQSKFVGEISKPALDLLLYGNSKYAGELLFLAPTALKLFSFTELGVFKYFGDYWLGASLLLGNNFQEITLNKGEFFTAEDGSYMSLGLDFEHRKSDTSRMGFGAINGIGAALSFGYRSDNLKIEVNNLGFISWNSKSLAVVKKGTYYYDGFAVSDPRNLEEVFLSESADSVVEEFSNFSKEAYLQNIIGTINVRWDKNAQWSFVGRYDFSKYNLPELTAWYSIGKNGSKGKSYFSPSLTIGGYGLYGFGVAHTNTFSKGMKLEIATRHLQAIVLPKKTNGISLYIKISKTI